MSTKEKNSFADLFVNCQDSIHKHAKLIPELKKLHNSIPDELFFRYFVNAIGSALTTPDRNVYAERVLEFASNFASSFNVPENEDNPIDEPDNPFLVKLIHYLADRCSALDQVYRFRTCQLLNKLLHSLDSVDDELYEKLCKILLERLKDKIAAVRVQASFALSRLQDPGNEDCPIISAFIFHLGHDPNPDVRKAILSGIDASARTLLPIVERTRDVKDSVRAAAYSYIAERIHLKSLSISNRIRILKEGLTDRSDTVKNIVSKTLLSFWVKKAGGVINFIQCLDVQGSHDTTKLALQTYFNSQTPEELVESFDLLNDEKVIPAEKLSCESAMYWCCLVQHVKNLNEPKADECAESLLPELVNYISYVKDFILNTDASWDLEKKLKHEFISKQLLILTVEFELSDLACQRYLDQLINDLLLSGNMGPGIIKPMVACYIKLHQGFDNQLNGIAEIISNIREPILTIEVEKLAEERRLIEMEIAKMKVKLNIERDELAQAILQQDFVSAQNAKDKIKTLEEKKKDLENELIPSSQEVRSEKNDPDTLVRCLTLITELLQQQNKSKMSATLQMLMETLLLPGIQNPDPAVRNQAVLALGLCCLISKDAACQHFVLFLQITQIDQEGIQVTALKALCDLLLNYGLESFQTDEENVEKAVHVVPETPPEKQHIGDETIDKNKFISNVMTILKSQLDSEFQDVRATAAEGLGKLLLYNRIRSPSLLSHFIILWYNPATENETFLRHFLGVFLPYFAASGTNSLSTFEDAFLPTILTLMDAPRSSPLMQVDIINVAKFILQLTSQNFVPRKSSKPNEETSVHENLAWAVCNEILKNPGSACTREWTKILTCMDTPTQYHPSHKELLVLVEKLLEKVRDKQSLSHVRSFHQTLSSLVTSSQSQEESDNPNSAFGSPVASRLRLDSDAEDIADDNNNMGDGEN